MVRILGALVKDVKQIVALTAGERFEGAVFLAVLEDTGGKIGPPCDGGAQPDLRPIVSRTSSTVSGPTSRKAGMHG